MILKKCFIIYNEPGENALPDELDVLDQAEYIGNTLIELGISVSRKGITTDFMNELKELAESEPGFVFNLVESINNKGELCYFVPALLNMYSIPYTGNPVEAMFNTTSKAITGRTLKNARIKNPSGFTPSEYKKLVSGRKYIIKPVWEDGSMGITSESVFTFNPDSETRLKEYRDTHWLIEEYIDGREFNISLLSGDRGPEVLPPAEMVFHGYPDDMPKIVDFRAKWETQTFEYKNTRREFPGDRLNPSLKKKILSAALRCWKVFGLRGYARVDMRVDNNDIPYVIEVNANPCISPDSGFVAATKAAGLSFAEVIQRIIKDLNIY